MSSRNESNFLCREITQRYNNNISREITQRYNNNITEYMNNVRPENAN